MMEQIMELIFQNPNSHTEQCTKKSWDSQDLGSDLPDKAQIPMHQFGYYDSHNSQSIVKSALYNICK